jgi:predicted sulfurtransferase
LRKVEELVGYGLAGEKAPEIGTKTSVHLEADEYHAMMTDTKTAETGLETVIIDVRNAYESAIGHFAPPPGGAKLIDPKMRNSHDFPG